MSGLRSLFPKRRNLRLICSRRTLNILLISVLGALIVVLQHCVLEGVTDRAGGPTSRADTFFFSSELLVENISKPNNSSRWFEFVDDEEYFQNNLSVFTASLELKNSFDHTFLIKGENICSGADPFLLLLIPSVASNTELRSAIRETWLRAAETNAWPGIYITEQIKHLFLFGCSDEQSCVEETDHYQNESTTFGDIVQADFIDSYRNLSLKIVLGLKWVEENCPRARFVVKVDEDTLINVPLLIRLIRHVITEMENKPFVLGLRHGYQTPPVVRGDDRWGVSVEEYPLDVFPAYMYGHTYVIHGQAVHRLIKLAHHVTLIAPEDAFITGILPKTGNISRISAPSFTVCCRQIYDCEVVWNQNVALPEVKQIFQLERLWVNIASHVCHLNTPFIGT